MFGNLVYERTLVGIAEDLNESSLIEAVGDQMVELAAWWAFVLLVADTIL